MMVNKQQHYSNHTNSNNDTFTQLLTSPIPNERKMYIHPYYEQSTFSTWSTIPTTDYLPPQENMYTQQPLYHYPPIMHTTSQEQHILNTPPTTPQPQKRTRGRRVSNIIPHPGSSRIFDCKTEGCGKVFKRSEHLKRHIRSIHTMEKPFKCPYTHCNKCFSRSDNLNQHIRIHRHKSSPSSSTTTTTTTTSTTSPHLYPF